MAEGTPRPQAAEELDAIQRRDVPALLAHIAALEAAQDDVRRVLRRYTYGTASWRPTAAQSGTAVDIAYHLGIDLREGTDGD